MSQRWQGGAWDFNKGLSPRGSRRVCPGDPPGALKHTGAHLTAENVIPATWNAPCPAGTGTDRAARPAAFLPSSQGPDRCRIISDTSAPHSAAQSRRETSVTEQEPLRAAGISFFSEKITQG